MMRLNLKTDAHRRELDLEFFRSFDDILKRAEEVAIELQKEVTDVRKETKPGAK